MARPFRSRLWHHVSIPRWTVFLFRPPRGCHVLSTYFLSSSLLSLSLSSLPSLPLFPRSLSRRLLSPLLSDTRACVTGGGGDFSFLSSLLALFFSSLPLSSPLFIARGRNRFSLSHDLSLFFSSFSHSFLLFLAFFLARASLSLSLLSNGILAMRVSELGRRVREVSESSDERPVDIRGQLGLRIVGPQIREPVVAVRSADDGADKQVRIRRRRIHRTETLGAGNLARMIPHERQG